MDFSVAAGAACANAPMLSARIANTTTSVFFTSFSFVAEPLINEYHFGKRHRQGFLPVCCYTYTVLPQAGTRRTPSQPCRHGTAFHSRDIVQNVQLELQVDIDKPSNLPLDRREKDLPLWESGTKPRSTRRPHLGWCR